MKEKKSKRSPAIAAAAVVMGILDLLLVVLMVLILLLKPGGGQELASDLEENFSENAEEYGQDGWDTVYTAAETITYSSGTTANQSETEQPETDTEDADDLYAGFVFPDSDTVALTDSRIQETVTSASLCRRAINEIYARHGYAFTKQENTDFFNQYDWYKNMPKETDMIKVAAEFSTIEKENVEKLQDYENSKGWN